MFIITNLLQIVANSKPLLIAAGLLEALSMIIMMRRSSYLTDNYGDNGSQHPPDLWFGITDDRLFSYLSDLGADGRKAYQRINSWDFFPYMPSYMM
jgi:hypothetical protein